MLDTIRRFGSSSIAMGTPITRRRFRTVKLSPEVADALEAWRDFLFDPESDLSPALAAVVRTAQRSVNGRAKYVIGLSEIVRAALGALRSRDGVGPAVGSYVVVTAPGTVTTPMVLMRTGASLVEIAPSGTVAPFPAVDGVVPVAGPVDVWHGDDAAERISRGEPPDATIRGFGTARELTPEERAEYDALHSQTSLAAWVKRRGARLADADRQRGGFDHSTKPDDEAVFRARIASAEVTVTGDADAASRSAPKPRKKVRKR